MYVISGRWRDNVGRREDFEVRHPEIEIRCTREGFQIDWYASKDGKQILHEFDLGILLDKLEILTGES